jgi:hypothetical protein
MLSTGYDSHELDPLAGLKLRTSSYGWMSYELSILARKHCEGRLIFVLEGGYHLPSLADSVISSLKGLLHDSKHTQPAGLGPTSPGIEGCACTPSGDVFIKNFTRDEGRCVEPLDKILAVLNKVREQVALLLPSAQL